MGRRGEEEREGERNGRVRLVWERGRGGRVGYN